MNFLFHTVIEWGAVPVYYTIYQTGPTAFYAEVQDNPHRVGEAIDFRFGDEWKPECVLSERAFDFLLEDVRQCRKRSNVI